MTKTIRLLLRLLKNQRLNNESRSLILNFFLESIQVLPIRDTITFDDMGTVKINSKFLTLEKALQLREGAVNLQKNWTYRLIKDQVAYNAIKMGVHSSLTFEQLILSKASLWVAQQEALLIESLAGETVEIDSQE